MNEMSNLKTLKDLMHYDASLLMSENDICNLGLEWIEHFESKVDEYVERLNKSTDESERNSCRLNIYAYKMVRSGFRKFFNLDDVECDK